MALFTPVWLLLNVAWSVSQTNRTTVAFTPFQDAVKSANPTQILTRFTGISEKWDTLLLYYYIGTANIVEWKENLCDLAYK